MKVRESGMPSQIYWESLIDFRGLLEEMEVGNAFSVFEFGVGYGSFLRCFQGKNIHVAGVDIDQTMVATTQKRLDGLGIDSDIRCSDFLDDRMTRTFGLFDLCLLMNILHHISPQSLILMACQMLTPGGRIGICHWRDDVDTPRGPPQEMRIGLTKVKELMKYCSFEIEKAANSTRSPHHYFVVGNRIQDPDE